MRPRSLLVLALLVAAASCALPSDETAVPIDLDELGDSLRTDVSSTTTTTMRPTPSATTLEYFLIGSQGERQVVVAVEREIESSASLFERLLILFGEGFRTEEEAENNWFNPAREFTLTAATRDESVLTIDIVAINEDGTVADPIGIDANVLRDTAAQLVYTSSRFEDISSIRLLYDSERIRVPTQTDEGDSDGLLQTSDYPLYDPETPPSPTTTAPPTTTVEPDEPAA